jgi:hypothetical protein
VGSTVRTEPPGTGWYTAALVLLICSASGFAVLWATLWLPVLLTGGQGSLFLYPVVFLLAVGPWLGGWAALVMAARSRKEGGGRRSEAVSAASAITLVLGPVLLWFGPVVV